MTGNPAKPIKNFFKQRPFKHRRPIRSAIKEETAGGVIFRQGASTEFLMFQDAKGRWTIPKGHVEEGERYEETAEREAKEETGLKEVQVMDWLGTINFQYRREDALVLMTMHTYLIKALGDTNKIKKEEWMKDIRWFSANDALEIIEYEDIGKLFLLALKKIRNGRQ